MIEVDKEFLSALGERISRRRKELGLTQTELSKHFDCSQSMMAAYESGSRRLPVTFLPLLAEILDFSVNELLGYEEKEKPKKRGPAPKLQARFDLVQELPRAQQQVVMRMLDGLLEQST